MTVDFPNLDLDPPTRYRPISGLGEPDELYANIGEGRGEKRIQHRLEKMYTVLSRALDNSYASSYKALGEDSHDAEAMAYMGWTQLLTQNYWSGLYHCWRALHLGSEMEHLEEAARRVEEFDGSEGSESKEPLLPFGVEATVSGDDTLEVIEGVMGIEDHVDAPEDHREAAEMNLRLASRLLAEALAALRNSGSEGGAVDLYHMYFLLQSLQPRVCRKQLDEVGQYDSDAPFDSEQLAAYSHAMEGSYMSAGDVLSNASYELFERRPSLVDEGYRCYQNAGAPRKAHDFVEGHRVSGALKEYYPGPKQDLAQVFGRVRGIPPILISTISKSGSTFLTSEIQKRTASPFMKIMTSTGYDDPMVLEDALERFAKGGMVCRQHFPPDDDVLATVAAAGVDRVLFHVRDPRRALISWVFYQESTMRKNVRINREIRGTEPREYSELDFDGKIQNQVENFLEPTVEMMEKWITARDSDGHDVDIKITRFEDMISEPGDFFEEVLSFYGVTHRPALKSLIETLRRQPEHNSNKKRGGDVDEWEELISDPVKRDVLDAIPESIRSMYPEKEWSV